MTWSREFTDPIETPGKPLRTLREAAKHIQSLPSSEQIKPHWQDAVEHLLRASGSEAWMLLAWMFMLRALNHGKAEEPKAPPKKAAKVYKIVR